MKNLFIIFFLCALITFAGCGRDRAVVYSLEYADTGLNDGGGQASVSSFDAGAKNLAEKKLVNINTADEAELMSLKGIGRVRAAAVIEYRSRFGEFSAIEDIMNVSGIKEGTFAKIRDSITVR